MVPYFFVMIILAAYGIHRYALVYNYYKNRKNVAGPPPEIAAWPKVTVQLPIYNERYVIERLVEAVSQFDYPHDLLEIQVLDDSTDQTQQIARDCVDRYRALGLPDFLHPSRQSRRFQSGRASGRFEIRGRRVRRHLRRGFYSARRFSAPHRALLRRRKARHGANALELHQPQLFRAHRSRSHSARRPFRHRAFRALTAAAFSSISTALQASGAALQSRTLAAGSTTPSPKTPTFPTAPNCAAGISSICRISNAPPSCPSK